jgi:hypothetical protein
LSYEFRGQVVIKIARFHARYVTGSGNLTLSSCSRCPGMIVNTSSGRGADQPDAFNEPTCPDGPRQLVPGRVRVSGPRHPTEHQ